MSKVTVLTSIFSSEVKNPLLMKYISNYAKSAAQLLNQSDVVFNISLVSLNAEAEDEIIKQSKFIEFVLRNFPGSRFSIVGESENYATTINQCIATARTEYVMIWNIDDVMTPHSIRDMKQTLDDHQDVIMTYGNFNVCNDLEVKNVIDHLDTPEFTKAEDFVMKYPYGPSIMWRKNINKKVGYYDEQLNSSVDIDFTTRLALNGCVFKKTNTHVCNFMNIGRGLSTNPNTRMFLENELLKKRYVEKSEEQHQNVILNQLKNFGEYINIEELVK